MNMFTITVTNTTTTTTTTTTTNTNNNNSNTEITHMQPTMRHHLVLSLVFKQKLFN
jgi:hypothetical protein